MPNKNKRVLIQRLSGVQLKMSRTEKDSIASAITPAAEVSAPAEAEELQNKPDYSRRFLMHVTLTGAEFKAGSIIPFAGGAEAFRPEDEITVEQDFSRGIVRRITLQSVSSDYDKPVRVAMNLFNTQEKDASGHSSPALRGRGNTGSWCRALRRYGERA